MDAKVSTISENISDVIINGEWKNMQPNETIFCCEDLVGKKINIVFSKDVSTKILNYMSVEKNILNNSSLKFKRITIKNKISDFNFHKLTLLVDERLPSPIGHTNIRLAGTKIFGSAPYPLLTILPGNQSFLCPISSSSILHIHLLVINQLLSKLW